MPKTEIVRLEPQVIKIPPANPREIHPNVAFLAKLMDDIFEIPGTKVRIGLDGILGLIPVLGDLFTILIGSIVLREADRLGVSRWTKARMYGNYMVDTLVGIIPFFGDIFDFAFKAHRKNIRLLQEHLDRHPEFDGLAPRYEFNWPSALLASMAASVAISVYMLIIPKWLGMEDMDIGLTIAGLVALDGQDVTLFTRIAWHIANGILYVLVYAGVLRYRQKQSTVGAGAFFGVLLWLTGPMLLFPFLLGLWGVTNPGIFMLDLGHGWVPSAVNLGAHLLHGIVAGAIYKHRVAPTPNVLFRQL